jgi:hypothetical protein
VSTFDPIDTRELDRNKAEGDAKKRLAKTVEDEDLKWFMSDRRGRRIVWRLLSDAGVFRSSFNTNAMTMAFNEGNRNYGNKMLAGINAVCPGRFQEMQREALNGRDDGTGKQSN